MGEVAGHRRIFPLGFLSSGNSNCPSIHRARESESPVSAVVDEVWKSVRLTSRVERSKPKRRESA